MTEDDTKACSSCGEHFPENRLLLTGDGYLCEACEHDNVPDVDVYEAKFHRKEAWGALFFAALSVGSVFTSRLVLLFLVPLAIKLAHNAFKGGKAYKDTATRGLAVAAVAVVSLPLILLVYNQLTR